MYMIKMDFFSHPESIYFYLFFYGRADGDNTMLHLCQVLTKEDDRKCKKLILKSNSTKGEL